jgi:hypothetical protein
MLKHSAENRKRRLSALPNVGPYIYDVQNYGFTSSYIYIYIYGISRIRINVVFQKTVRTQGVTTPVSIPIVMQDISLLLDSK